MEKVSIYFNSRCKKCQSVMEILKKKQIEAKVVNYLEGTVTEQELKHVIKLLGISAEQLVRKNESVYKENFSGKNLTEEQWVKAMLEHPILIQRPIIIKGKKAVIGRPAEQVFDIL